MNAVVRLNFATKQLEMNGAVLGRFVPSTMVEGAVQLGPVSYTYLIKPRNYGERITIYRSREAIAVRDLDFHDGVFDLRVGEDLAFDLRDGILYGSKGTAGTVAFTTTELRMEFGPLVPAERLDVIAALVALDTMWANLVGFTRTRAEPGRAAPGERSRK